MDGAGDKAAIQERISHIKKELERVDSDFDRDKLQERLAKLSGGVAVLKVGAATEAELKEKKSRIEDALQATRAAVEEGIVAGGGVALINAIPALDTLEITDADEKVGVEIIRKAMEAPMRAIAQNAGFEGSVMVDKVRHMEKGEGVNFADGTTGKMIEMGVNDPVKVTRTALQSAASVAALILITECTINEIPKDPDPAAACCCRRCSRYGRHDVSNRFINLAAKGPASAGLFTLSLQSAAKTPSCGCRSVCGLICGLLGPLQALAWPYKPSAWKRRRRAS